MSGELAAILTKWGNPPAELVGKLPKPTSKDNKAGRCRECGGWHGLPAVHLDYMGHASVTRALIETDEHWNWEPVAFTEAGEPLITNSGGHLRMWARLTVLGKTVLCVGTCPSNKPEPEKELIGDMLRNGAMRLGIGLSLWAKEEWTDLGAGEVVETSATADQEAAGGGGGTRSSSSSSAKPAASGSSEQGTAASSDTGDGAGSAAPSPADVINRIRGLDEQTRADVKEYARSKGYKVTPASLTDAGAVDLNGWLDRRATDG
jgi:hypothetical protein